MPSFSFICFSANSSAISAASDFIVSFAFCSSNSTFALACSRILSLNFSPSAIRASFSFCPAFFVALSISSISRSVFLSRSLTSPSAFRASSFASSASLIDFSISSVRFLKNSFAGFARNLTSTITRIAKFITGQNQSFHVNTCSASSAAKAITVNSEQ